MQAGFCLGEAESRQRKQQKARVKVILGNVSRPRVLIRNRAQPIRRDQGRQGPEFQDSVRGS